MAQAFSLRAEADKNVCPTFMGTRQKASNSLSRIILLNHPLNFSGDPVPASELRDIDIIIFAGNTDFMAKAVPKGPFNLLRPEDSPVVDYPILREDADGNPVCLVNSGQNYRCIGDL